MSFVTASTRDELHATLTNIEVLAKEAFEEAVCGQSSRFVAKGETSRLSLLLDALINQDSKLKECLKTAEEQAQIQDRIDILTSELERKNVEILSLQKNLKEAESLLASVVFDAKKKLASIKRAEEKAVTPEELIRFAHRISASYAVAAPPTWQPGDPSRRPYPTDAEMRQGLLAKNFEKLRESYLNPSHMQAGFSSSSQSDLHNQGFSLSGYNWQSQSLETPTLMTSSIAQQLNLKQSNDVEIMSQSDTSSSSSSDEQ